MSHALPAEFMNVRPARGAFELVRVSRERVRVDGWMVLHDGPSDEVRVFWNGAPAGGVLRVSQRSDVLAARASFRGATGMGFLARLPVAESEGQGRVDLIVHRGGRPSERLSLRVFGPREMREPLPPAELTVRVSGVQGDVFRVRALKCFTDILDEVDRAGGLKPGARVLDWGCGCGAISGMFLRHVPDAQLDGCDVDPRGIAWCQANLVKGRFVTSEHNPPTPYADASFDLVIGSSVFTHLRVPDQKRWLAEMRRILRPGGLLLASAMGTRMFDDFFRGGRKRTTLHWARRLRYLALGFDDLWLDRTLDGVTPDGYYRFMYQTPRHVKRVWSRFLDVVDHIEHGLAGEQDLVILRR